MARYTGETFPISDVVQPGGLLPRYSSDGFPLFYVDDEGNELCFTCATMTRRYDYASVVGYDVNWNQTRLLCDDCGSRVDYVHHQKIDPPFNAESEMYAPGVGVDAAWTEAYHKIFETNEYGNEVC
jgi:hypothetical protein